MDFISTLLILARCSCFFFGPHGVCFGQWWGGEMPLLKCCTFQACEHQVSKVAMPYRWGNLGKLNGARDSCFAMVDIVLGSINSVYFHIIGDKLINPIP